jgi:hypothetical protein
MIIFPLITVTTGTLSSCGTISADSAGRPLVAQLEFFRIWKFQTVLGFFVLSFVSDYAKVVFKIAVVQFSFPNGAFLIPIIPLQTLPALPADLGQKRGGEFRRQSNLGIG